MTTMMEREKAFEAKFQLDQEVEFRIGIRRNKLLGLWAAPYLGLSDDAAKAYALAVMDVAIDDPTQDPVAKVAADLAGKVDEATIRAEATRLIGVARVLIMDEFRPA